MRPLREWRAAKAWQNRIAEPNRRPQRPYQSAGQGQHVLLLTQATDTAANNAIEAFAKTRNGKADQVHTLRYTPEKLKPEQLSDQLWSPASLQFNGMPKQQSEAFWRKLEYDLVIHCALAPFLPFDYLVAGLTAHRRIAAYDDAIQAYDLVVSPKAGGGVDSFLQQIDHYLPKLSPQHG